MRISDWSSDVCSSDLLHADDGEVRVQNGIVVARMAQEVPQGTKGSVFEVVAEGLGDLGRLLARYHHLLDAGDFDALGDVQHEIEVQQIGRASCRERVCRYV